MTDTRTTELYKALDFMRIWISNDAHLGESEFSYELEKAEGLRKLEAIEQAIAAMVGKSKVTSDQESIVCSFLRKISPNRDWDYLGEHEHAMIADFVDAIAVTLGRKKCHAIAIYNFYDEWCGDKCSECDYEWYEDEPNYCPNCGAQVEGAAMISANEQSKVEVPKPVMSLEESEIGVEPYRETRFEYSENLGEAKKSISIETYLTSGELIKLCHELMEVG